MTEHQPTPQTQAGNQSGNVKALLTYAFGWITGLIFLLTEREDEFIRFHAAQSVVVFGGLNILAFIPIIGAMINLILMPLTFILWIVLMLKAYQNEKFMLPVVSEWAQKLEPKIK